MNNHSPQFVNTPYHVMVDELTPVGLNIFRGIRAVDLDKANTPNSDIKYSIIDGNEKGKFTLENGHNPGLLVHKALDYDTGDHEFQLVIQAAVGVEIYLHSLLNCSIVAQEIELEEVVHVD